MGSCPVFKWARAVLNPHYLTLLPESLDRISLLTEVAASLKLTADVSSDIDSPALQGEWEAIIQAQMKLLGLISETQISTDKNGKEADHEDSSTNLKQSENETIGNSAVSDGEVAATVELEIRENDDIISKDSNIQEVAIFAKNWKNSDSENYSIEIKNSSADVRNVFVIADDYHQLDLLPSIARTVSSQSGTAIGHVDNQDEPITTLVDGSESQLIFVTGTLLESGDKTAEDVCEKVEDELYMNIVLAPRKDCLKVAGASSNETTNTNDKDNPLNKLCQLLRIDEEEAGDKRCEELERKRRYERNLPYKYFCSNCSFKTKRENHYQKHLKLHEKNHVLYRCSKCQFTTIRVGMLRRHEMQHRDGRLLNCKQCSYKTDSSKLLAKHMQTRHSPSRRGLKCADCGFKSGSQRDLNHHKRVHSPVKPKEYWECNQCTYKTQNKGHLVRHKNDVHGSVRPFLCHHCGKSFKRHDTLKQHKIVHGEVTKTHTCSECNKICRTSAQLKDHMTVHSTQRPFLCELCGATFKTRSIQCRHVRKMHSDVSFQCSFCKQSFSSKPTLMKHAKTHR